MGPEELESTRCHFYLLFFSYVLDQCFSEFKCALGLPGELVKIQILIQ